MSNEDVFQIVALLSGIVSVLTGLLTLGKSFKENGFFRSLQLIIIIVIPTLFIAQLLFAIRLFFYSVITTCAVISLLILGIKKLFKDEHVDEIQGCMFFIPVFCFVSEIVRWIISLFGMDSKLESIKLFLDELKNYKISFGMYLYLADNIYLVFILILDGVLMWLTIQSIYFIWKDHEVMEKRERGELEILPYSILQVFLSAFVAIIISTGLGDKLVELMIGLF